MNTTAKRFLALLFLSAVLLSHQVPSAQASLWKEKDGYWKKTGGKFVFGLKHSLCSWMMLWTESREPQYTKEWEGFAIGLGKMIPYTATGLIQLVTFPIPVDIPDIGIGLHMPDKDCPENHRGHSKKIFASKIPASNGPAPEDTLSGSRAYEI